MPSIVNPIITFVILKKKKISWTGIFSSLCQYEWRELHIPGYVYINISSHCTFKNVKKENKNRQGFKTCTKIEISLNVSSSSSSLCYLENRNEHWASLKKKHSYFSHLHPYPPPWGLTKWVIDMMFFGPCTMLSDRLRYPVFCFKV